MTTNPKKKILEFECKGSATHITDYWNKIRQGKLAEIRPLRLNESNSKMRKYWKDVIRELEYVAKTEAKKSVIRTKDLSTSLPPSLYKRVSKIIQLMPIDEDRFEEDVKEEMLVDIAKLQKRRGHGHTTRKETAFNESTCSFIDNLEDEFPKFEFNADQELTRAMKTVKDTNWQSTYICKKRKDRIQWNSKIYHITKSVWDKPLYEQAEQLMDSAAERFSDWVNSLGSNQETHLSKDLLKSLFSLESGNKLLGGIQIDPKEVRAVPHTVAETWGVPEMSMDRKLAKKIQESQINIPQKIIKVAFARTLPYHMRPWIPSDADNIIKPDFPEDLRTREVLFQGISHLRSTRALVEHYKENPTLSRPEYLEEIGCFDLVQKTESVKPIPLYEMLGLKI